VLRHEQACRPAADAALDGRQFVSGPAEYRSACIQKGITIHRFAPLCVAASYPRRRRAQTKKIVMSRNIDDYFSMHSPWAYIGHVPFMEIAHRNDVKVIYKPISLSDVFAETGGLPVTKHHPARLSYRILELHRWRDMRASEILAIRG